MASVKTINFVFGSGSGDESSESEGLDSSLTKAERLRISYVQNITKQVTTMVLSNAEYYIGKYESMTEDYKGMENLQNARKAVNMTTNFLTATIKGAVSASAFGPVGTAIGAVVGATLSVVNSKLASAKEYLSAMEAIHNNAYSNYFYGERAGFVDGGRGTNN